jgi:uncharacterized protein
MKIPLSPSLLCPDLEACSLNDIDIDELKAQGIDALLFDVDGTLCHFHGTKTDSRVKDTYELMKENFKTYIVSNALSRRRKLLEYYFGTPAVQTDIKKPFPEPFEEALLCLGVDKSKAAMIGDRYLMDVAGANNAGIYSIKVKCIDLMQEPITTTLIRGIESALVGIYRFLGYDKGKSHKSN